MICQIVKACLFYFYFYNIAFLDSMTAAERNEMITESTRTRHVVIDTVSLRAASVVDFIDEEDLLKVQFRLGALLSHIPKPMRMVDMIISELGM